MATEVASIRLPPEVLRELDRRAAEHGLSRGLYLVHLIELGRAREQSDVEHAKPIHLRAAMADELKPVHDNLRRLTLSVQELKSATLAKDSASPASPSHPSWNEWTERLAFSSFFVEALLKRLSATLLRNPSELGQLVRDTRDQASAELKQWRDRTPSPHHPE